MEAIVRNAAKAVRLLMMESLGRNDRVLNRLAAEALAAAGRDVARTLMIEALTSDNIWYGVTQRKNASVDLRQTTATAFGKIGPVALPALTELLEDGDLQVRCRAAWALGEMGPAAETAIPALVEALRDKDGLVRCYVASALAKIGPAAVPILTELLRDKDEHLRRTVAEVVGNIGPEAETAVPALMELLSDEDVFVRQTAARALGNIGPGAKTAVSALTELLKHEARQEAETDVPFRTPLLGYTGIREDVAVVLGRIGRDAKSSVPTLTELLSDKEGSVRQAAALAIRNIGPVATAATPALTNSLRDENGAVRTLAAFALGRIGLDAAPAIPTLTELLSDKEESVRQAAAWALGEIGFSVHEDRNTAEAMGEDPGRPWQASRKRRTRLAPASTFHDHQMSLRLRGPPETMPGALAAMLFLLVYCLDFRQARTWSSMTTRHHRDRMVA